MSRIRMRSAAIDPTLLLLPTVVLAAAGAMWAIGQSNSDDTPRHQALPVLRAGDGVALLLIPRGSVSDDQGVLVTVPRAFFLARTEVTQATWTNVMEDNPSHERGDDLPVERVSWDDCQEFLRRLSRRHGRTYRLPTEQEWTYAAVAGSDGHHFDGARRTYLHTRALTPANACPGNGWDVRGLHGNVWEWCSDVLPDGKRAMRGGS
jgi:formylglycine-generating enzyme required for sulfatase activity